MDNKYLDEKENKKAKGIFYVTISIVTLVVAIIGASFSYFIASASSDSDAIETGSTVFSLVYEDNFQHLLNTDLIPAANNVVYYSAFEQNYAADNLYTEFKNNPVTFNKEDLAGTKCRDDNGNAVCSLYTFTITNPTNTGVEQTLNFEIVQLENSFANLYLMVRDASVDLDPNKTVKTGITIDKYHLGNENLDYDSQPEREYYNLSKKNENGECITGKCMQAVLQPGQSKTYQLVIYIENLEDVIENGEIVRKGDQTSVDANKNFIGSVVISPEGGTGQIYGVIRNASGKFNN